MAVPAAGVTIPRMTVSAMGNRVVHHRRAAAPGPLATAPLAVYLAVLCCRRAAGISRSCSSPTAWRHIRARCRRRGTLPDCGVRRRREFCTSPRNYSALSADRNFAPNTRDSLPSGRPPQWYFWLPLGYAPGASSLPGSSLRRPQQQPSFFPEASPWDRFLRPHKICS